MLDINDILSGNQKHGARLIRLIENNDAGAVELIKQLYPHSGKAFRIGITGSPGVGKSTLIDALILEFRCLGKTVAVIAVDPTSPISGGAILGDRIRMQRHATDPGVFIRSMASRGQKGGLSRATSDAAIVLDAMGYDIIIIETVGAGQGEFDIAGIAHSTGIVCSPETGDGLQTIKAGILETGDVFIVNRGDRAEAESTVHQLTMMINTRTPSETGWTPRVHKTMANNGTGVKELAATFQAHFDLMKQTGLLDRKKAASEQRYFKTLLTDLVLEKLMLFMETSPDFRTTVENIQSRNTDPVSAAQCLARKIFGYEGK